MVVQPGLCRTWKPEDRFSHEAAHIIIYSTDTGHGTLYTSGSEGIIYSESLRRHLYPNFGQIHDFYKVKSMRGVYITSQMSDDDSIHTMISYNRGAQWQKIPKPDYAECKDKNKVL